MSLEEVKRVQNDPNYTRTTGFIIEFQGMAIDGYDHENDTYASPGVVINDFLDDRNNCYFSKDDSDSDSVRTMTITPIRESFALKVQLDYAYDYANVV